ncbi:hypothetical protein [Amycolatopsis sp. NPDC050768]|uniref:hypothetical protein n=1 Tax=Amycolatopsis sp. NPDC050768 TaxID=3154839 RepID=UPI0033D954B9
MSSLFSRIRDSISRRGRYTARLDDGRVVSTDSPAEMLNLFADVVRQTGFGPRTTDFDGRRNADELEALEHLFTDARPEPGTPAEAEWADAVAHYLDTSGNYRQAGRSAAEPAGQMDEATAGFEWGMFAGRPMPQPVVDAYRQLGDRRGTPVDVEAVHTAVDGQLHEHALQRAQAEMTHPDDSAYDDLVAEAAGRQDSQGLPLAEFLEQWRAETHEVGEADVNDTWGPLDRSPVSSMPERTPPPESWIARNLQAHGPGAIDGRRRVAGDAIDRYRGLRAAGSEQAGALAQVGPERSLDGQAAIGFASMVDNGISEEQARVQAIHDAVLQESVEQGYEMWTEEAPAANTPRPAWMDELEQTATRAVAERHHDRAFLRSLQADAETDPIRRGALEADAQALAARAEKFTERAAELGQNNDPLQELEIQHAVDDMREQGLNFVFDSAEEAIPPALSEGRRLWLQSLMGQGMSLQRAEEHVRTHARADDGIGRYRRALAEGMSEQDAAARAASGDDVADTAITAYREHLAQGLNDGAAHYAAEEAAVDAALGVSDNQQALWSAEQGTALTDPTQRPEGRDVDADWRWNPPASSLVPEREPEPDSWIARHLPATPDLVVPDEYEPDYLTAEEDELEQLAYDMGEEGTSPYLGMAAPMVVNQTGVLRRWGPAPDETHNHFVEDADADAATSGPVGFEEGDRFSVPVVAEEDGADDVLDRIDDVLAEPEPTPLAEVVTECGHAVEAAAEATHRIEVAGEDTDRAQRLARWNADDHTDERADDSNDGWGRE